MDARVKDRVVVESDRAAQAGRAGVIEEVFFLKIPRPPRSTLYRYTSIFAPSAGVARIERRKRERVQVSVD